MDFVNTDYQTIKVSYRQEICSIQFNRPEANNTLNETLISEFSYVLQHCIDVAKAVVIEGLPEVFCFGADFQEISSRISEGKSPEISPEPLYDLWHLLATGPFISIAHVRGKTNAGGLGFVSACDIVICDASATFSLSELLFGLMPACVMPFLVRRIGISKANYLTLSTQSITALTAQEWGLVDCCEDNSVSLLRKHLLRIHRLSKSAVTRYKHYMNGQANVLAESKTAALAANKAVFSDENILSDIDRYIQKGIFPWEKQ